MANAQQQGTRGETEKPITERSNPRSFNIDTASSLEIADILHACEKEIFSGWGNYQSMFHDEILEVGSYVSAHMTRLLKGPSDSRIIISGCGTSGRLGFFLAAKTNELLGRLGIPPRCDYIIAGGYKALTHSVEAFEDSPDAGRSALIQMAVGRTRILFIGITCGLSAPFVAGQLDHCMAHPDIFTPILLGFNPAHQARDQPIEGWDQTFLSVTRRLENLQKDGKACILNPVVGPEPITGSSRMKAGGATKLLLETCFLTAISCALPFSSSTASNTITSASSCDPDNQSLTASISSRDADLLHLDGNALNDDAASGKPTSLRERTITALLGAYPSSWEGGYQAMREPVGELIEFTGQSLNTGGHVYYLGWDTWGLQALIDASECPPTFGSDFDDVRGFIKGGLSHLVASCRMHGVGSNHNADDETSIKFFEAAILPRLGQRETVIFLLPSQASIQEAGSLLRQVREKTRQVGIITAFSKDSSQELIGRNNHQFVLISRPDQQVMAGLRQETGLALDCEVAFCDGVMEFSVKSALNAISTGAHIKRGKVFRNYMIDLKLSNSKLLNRGIGMVKNLTGCSPECARKAVFLSIFQTDDITTVEDTPISSVIQTAADVERVLPTAIILALRKCTVREAREVLKSEPIIRTSLVNLLHNT